MSIVAMKRKSRKLNRPISSGSFSLYGSNSSSTMSTSGLLASRVKRIPIHVERDNKEQSTYIYDLAKKVEYRNDGNKQLDSGVANCDSTCYNGAVPTLTKSAHAHGAISSSEHIRAIGGCDC